MKANKCIYFLPRNTISKAIHLIHSKRQKSNVMRSFLQLKCNLLIFLAVPGAPVGDRGTRAVSIHFIFPVLWSLHNIGKVLNFRSFFQAAVSGFRKRKRKKKAAQVGRNDQGTNSRQLQRGEYVFWYPLLFTLRKRSNAPFSDF